MSLKCYILTMLCIEGFKETGKDISIQIYGSNPRYCLLRKSCLCYLDVKKCVKKLFKKNIES